MSSEASSQPSRINGPFVAGAVLGGVTATATVGVLWVVTTMARGAG